MSQVVELRSQLVRAVRMLENAALLDMNGHLSCRIPGTDTILIHSRLAPRGSLTEDDVVIIDLDGQVLEGAGEPPSEFHIHTSMYRARPDVNSVLHNHPHWQTVLGIARIPQQPVFSIGAFVDPTSPVFETSSLINTRELGDELAETTGESNYVLMRHHGAALAVGSIEEAFVRAVFVEENAQKVYHAALLGPVQPMVGENLDRARATNWQPKIATKVWRYYEARSRVQGVFRDLEN